ncbi:HGGxSTG domain-containing protein [Lysobacter cavernae]|uniref:HGGxSTG domain-containing protein n=1 Tax=Lysobacter cavernae TaxID=1685901 RepID=A0ABV7RJ09_9GAMM
MKLKQLTDCLSLPPRSVVTPRASKPGRVICNARLANGGTCSRKSELGRRRCRYHGGCSTGPRTRDGKARVTLNLPRCRSVA